MQVKAPDNLCVICGNVIPEGRQACPNCEAAVSETTDKIMSKVNDELEQAFRKGYTTGFEEAMKTACGLKQENARLQRENDYLRSTIQRHSSEEVEYE
jgi:ribosome modulation factor